MEKELMLVDLDGSIYPIYSVATRLICDKFGYRTDVMPPWERGEPTYLFKTTKWWGTKPGEYAIQLFGSPEFMESVKPYQEAIDWLNEKKERFDFIYCTARQPAVVPITYKMVSLQLPNGKLIFIDKRYDVAEQKYNIACGFDTSAILEDEPQVIEYFILRDTGHEIYVVDQGYNRCGQYDKHDMVKRLYFRI